MSNTVVRTVPGGYLMPSLRHATVVDAMHPGIVSCPPDMPLTDVARLMATHPRALHRRDGYLAQRPERKIRLGTDLRSRLDASGHPSRS